MQNASKVGAYFVRKLQARHIESLRAKTKEMRLELAGRIANREETLARLRQEHVQEVAEISKDGKNALEMLQKLLAEKDRYNSRVAEVDLTIERLKSRIANGEKEVQEGLQPSTDRAESFHGIGMLIYAPSLPGVVDARGRLMPPLTLKREDVDRILRSDGALP